MRKEQFSTWFSGTDAEWRRIPIAEREDIAFKATGCEVAYPTWDSPVDCVHGGCLVRRGERKPIHLVNGAMRYEREAGWLRFTTDRRVLARLYRHLRSEARRTGIYDIWKLGWSSIVGVGIGAD